MNTNEKRRAERRAICRTCPERKPGTMLGEKLDRCGKCGCLIIAKTALEGAKCPLGKW